MQSRIPLLLLIFIATIAREIKLTDANVLFRFALDFKVKSDDSTETDDAFDKTITFSNNHLTIRNNLNPSDSIEENVEQVFTERPNERPQPDVTTTIEPLRSMSDFWLQEQNLNSDVDTKLKEIVDALTKLNGEISRIVERSDFLEYKLKIITRYMNILDASAAEELNLHKANNVNKFEHLRKFIKLVDKLKEPATAVNNSERQVDYILLKLALEKYKIVKLQEDVAEQITAAEEAWQQYVKSKLVEVNA